MISKPLSIEDARAIGKKSRADRVIIFAVDDNGVWSAASYGRTRKECGELRDFLEGEGGANVARMIAETGDRK